MNNQFYNYSKDGLTQGVLAKFMNCRQECKLFLQGWAPKSQTSPALIYGTILHSTLEHVYADIAKGKLKFCPTSVVLRNYVQTVKRIWVTDNSNASNESRKILEASLCIAEATLPGYFKRWWKDDTTKIKWVELEK